MSKYPGLKLTIEHGNAGEFGKYYVGCNKWRQNQRKRKQLAKQNRKH